MVLRPPPALACAVMAGIGLVKINTLMLFAVDPENFLYKRLVACCRFFCIVPFPCLVLS